MTIEEAIKKLSQSAAVIGCEDWMGARDLALDTMRKYQQIEQILKDIPYGGDVTVRRIQEVVEDGNDT